MNNELKIKVSVDDEPLIKAKKTFENCKKSAKELGLSKRQIRKLFNKIISVG